MSRLCWRGLPFLAGTLAAVALLVGCGSTKPSSTRSTPAPSTAQRSAALLSAAQLRDLIVEPPAPFAKLPDSLLDTGLMEIGNPHAGTLGIGFATTAQLQSAGFQRGWESAFRARDGAVIDTNVFEFASAAGPAAITRIYLAHRPAGYRSVAVPGVSGARAVVGTSPEGRTAVGTAFGHERFLVVLVVGGQPGAHDYLNLLEDLARRELARVSAVPNAT